MTRLVNTVALLWLVLAVLIAAIVTVPLAITFVVCGVMKRSKHIADNRPVARASTRSGPPITAGIPKADRKHPMLKKLKTEKNHASRRCAKARAANAGPAKLVYDCDVGARNLSHHVGR